jgi:hypothetical protein
MFASSSYFCTTPDPGDSDVLTYPGTCNPFSDAFLHSIAACIMTSGLDVFVQEVIAAITTEPCFKVYSLPLVVILTVFDICSGATSKPLKPFLAGMHLSKSDFMSFSKTLSCGLLGPDRHGSTLLKSRFMISPDYFGIFFSFL